MLRSPDQLPDVDATVFEIAWDLEEPPGEADWYVPRWGDRELWRMPAGWEDYQTFVTVAGILSRKFGPRLKDVVPSRAAESNMWGDRLSTPSWIDAARRRVRAALQSPYVDMDGALLAWDSAGERISQHEAREYEGRLDRIPRIFARLRSRPGAVAAVMELSAVYEVRILAAAQRELVWARRDKGHWVERRLPDLGLWPREKLGRPLYARRLSCRWSAERGRFEARG